MSTVSSATYFVFQSTREMHAGASRIPLHLPIISPPLLRHSSPRLHFCHHSLCRRCPSCQSLFFKSTLGFPRHQFPPGSYPRQSVLHSVWHSVLSLKRRSLCSLVLSWTVLPPTPFIFAEFAGDGSTGLTFPIGFSDVELLYPVIDDPDTHGSWVSIRLAMTAGALEHPLKSGGSHLGQF